MNPNLIFYDLSKGNVDTGYGARGMKPLGEYDKYAYRALNQGYNRAANQSAGEAWWNGLVSRTLSIAPKIGAGLGSVAYGIAALTPYATIEDIWTNPITTSMMEADEKLRESLPVLKTRAYAESGLLGKMGTAGFWADDAFDGIAYAASAYVPGAALSRLGTGIAKLAAGGSRLTGRLASAGESVITPLSEAMYNPNALVGNALGNAAKLPHALAKAIKAIPKQHANLLSATAYNTVAEAGAEAYQTQKEIEEFYRSRNEILPADQRLTEEQIKYSAGAAAKETFQWNAAVLALPNYIQNKFFHSSFKTKSDDIARQVFESEGKKEAVKGLTSKYKAMGLSMLSEGFWEENIQTAIQQYERAYAKGITDYDMATEIGRSMVKGVAAFGKSLVGADTNDIENEQAMSIFLGSLIGGGTALVFGAKDRNQENKVVSEAQSRYKELVNTVGKQAAQMYVDNYGSIFKKDGTVDTTITKEDGTTETIKVPKYLTTTDDKGNTVLQKDADKMLLFITNSLRNKTMFDLDTLAAAKNDPMMNEYHKQMSLSLYAYELVAKGYSSSEIEIFLKQQSELESGEAEQLGIKTDLKDNNAAIVEIAKSIEETRDSMVGKDDDGFSNFLFKSNLMLKAKLRGLEKVESMTTNQSTKDAITKLKEDVVANLEDLKNRDAIKAEYDSTIVPKYKMVSEYFSLKDKPNKTKAELDRMSQLEFEYNEETFINGEYSSKQSDYQLTSHLSPLQLTQTFPGRRTEENYLRGSQDFAEQAIESELDKANPSILASKMLESFRFDTPKSKQLVTEVSNRLGNEVSTLEEAYDDIKEYETSMGELVSYFEDDFDDPDFSGGTTMEDIYNRSSKSSNVIKNFILSHGLEATDENGDVDYTETLRNFLVHLSTDVTASGQELKAKLRSVVGEETFDSVPVLGFKKSQLQQLSELSTKQWKNKSEVELQKEFLEKSLYSPSDEILKDLKSNPDSFIRKEESERLIDRLEAAKKVYETRKEDKVVEAIDSYIKKLVDAVAKANENLDKREAKQVQVNNEIVNIVADIVFEEPLTSTTSNITVGASGIKELLITIVGKDELNEAIRTVTKDFNEKKKEGDNKAKYLNYEALIALLSHAKSKATPEQLKELIEKLNVHRTAIAEQMFLDYKNSTVPSNVVKTLMIESTNNGLVEAIRHIFKEETQNPESPIFKFLVDGDYVSLLNSLATDKTIVDNKAAAGRSTDLSAGDKKIVLRRLIEYRNRMTGIDLVLGLASDNKLFETKKELFFRDLTPTPQQDIAITQALSYLSSIESNEGNTSSWVTIDGLPGAGKTNLVAKILVEILVGKDVSKVYAFSSNSRTSSNINSALFSETRNSSLGELLNMSDEKLSKIDYLVIDEVYTLSDENVYSIIRKLNEHYKNTKHVVKVLGLGDPSQYSKETMHILKGNSYKGKSTIPLSATYRTNVGAISSFYSNFQLRPSPVVGLYAQSNTTIDSIISTNTTGDAIGVIATSSEDKLIDALNTESNGKKRVLVVNSNAVAYWASKVNSNSKSVPKNVDIVSIDDIQGYQWDEVYVALDTSQIGATPLEINRGLYTTYSRAKSLVVILSPDYNNYPPRQDLDTVVSDSAAELTTNIKNMKTMIDNTQSMLNKLNNVTVPTDITQPLPPQDVDETPTTNTDVEVVQGPPDTTSVTITTPEGSYSVQYPTNRAILNSGILNHDFSTPLKGKVVRFRKDNKDIIMLLVQSNGKYYAVSSFGDRDFSDAEFGPVLASMDKPSKFTAYGIISSKGFPAIIEDSVLGELDITGVSKMGNAYTPTDWESSDIVSDIIIKFVNSYYGTTNGLPNYPGTTDVYQYGIKVGTDLTKHWLKPDGTVNWDVVRNHVEVKIITAKDQKDIPGELNIRKGMPYLIIRNPSQSSYTENKDQAASIYIPLDSKKLSSSSPLITSLQQLTDVLEELQTLGLDYDARLGDEDNVFMETVREFGKSNFEVVSNTASQYPSDDKILKLKTTTISIGDLIPSFKGSPNESRINELLTSLVPMVMKATSSKKYYFSEEEVVAEGYVPEYHKGTNGKPDFWFARQENKSYVTDWTLSTDGGTAQHALNSLAQANEYIINPYRLRMTVVKDKVTLYTAGSLLSNKYFIDWRKMHDDLPWTNSMWGDSSPSEKSLQHFINKAVATGNVASKKEAEDLIELYKTQPMSLAGLRYISKAFDENGRHPSIRTPLYKSTFDKFNLAKQDDRKALSELVNTRYNGTRRTTLFVGTAKSSKEVVPKREFSVVDAKQGISDLSVPPQMEPLKQLIVNNIGSVKIVITENKLLERGSFSRETNIITLDGVPTDQLDILLVLHEGVHAITSHALERAIFNENPTSKEVQFFKELKKLYTIAKRNGITLKDFDTSPSLDIITNPERAHPDFNNVKQFRLLTEFVASLSNLEFRQKLQAIKVKEESLLDRILRSILTFMGLTESNVYDLALASIKKLYATEESAPLNIPIQTNEYEEFRKFLIVNPEGAEVIFDETTGQFTEDFNKLSTEDKLAWKNALMGVADLDISISYALIAPAREVTIGTPGLIFSSAEVDTAIKDILPDASEKVHNVINAVVYKHMESPEDSFVWNNTLSVEANPIPYFWEFILDDLDKNRIKAALGKFKDVEVIEAMSTTGNYYGDIIREAVKLMVANSSKLDRLVTDVDFSSNTRYLYAKSWIVNKLYINSLGEFNTSTINEAGFKAAPLIKTRKEITQYIINQLKSRTGELAMYKAKYSQLIKQYRVETDALKKATIRKEILPLREVIVSLSSLLKTNSRTGNMLFFDVYTDIYPSNPFTSERELENEDYTIEDGHAKKESTGISEHIKEYNTSQEMTLSESVKDFLTLVKVDNAFLNPGFVYLRMLYLSQELDMTDLDTLSKFINSALEKIANPEQRAVLEKFKTVTNLAKSNSILFTGEELPSNVNLLTKLNRLTGEVEYYVAYNLSSDISNETLDTLPEGTTTIKYNTSAEALAIINSYTPVSTYVFNYMYLRSEAQNQIRELHNLFGSMTENELMIAETTNSKFDDVSKSKGFSVRYYPSKASGFSGKVKDEIVAKLRDYYRDKKRLDGFKADFINHYLTPNKLELRNINNSPATKQAIVKQFLAFIGLGEYADDVIISADRLNDFIESMLYTIDSVSKVKILEDNWEDTEDEKVLLVSPTSEGAEVEQQESNTLKGEMTFKDLITHLSSKLNNIASIVEQYTDLTRNPSVKTSTGSKYYKFHESAWAKDTLRALIAWKNNSTYFRKPEHLNSPLYDHNIFLSRHPLTFQAEHEGLWNIDINRSVQFQRENKYYWLRREVLAGFWSGLQQSSSKTFYLFSHPPSDKPKSPVYKVGLISDNDAGTEGLTIKKSIKATLQYFIDKRNLVISDDLWNKALSTNEYRHFELMAKAEKVLGTKLDSSNIDAFVSKVYDLIEEEALAFAKEIISMEFTLPVDYFSVAGSETFKQMLNASQRQRLSGKTESTKVNARTEGLDQEALKINPKSKKKAYNDVGMLNDILPMIDLYFKNYYVQSFHLFQLYGGDVSFYKAEDDVVKRMAGSYAPGIKGSTNKVFGMREQFKVLIVNDKKESTPIVKDRFKDLLFGERELTSEENTQFESFFDTFGKSFDAADAQGFMLPERQENLTKGFGRSWNMGNVMKPVHFELRPEKVKRKVVVDDVETTEDVIIYVPTYLKYSSVVLTNELVDKFPILDKIRNRLREADVDELVMQTGNKLGNPVNAPTPSELLGEESLEGGIITLSNKHYRFQHNPAVDPQKEVSLFTQLMYFISSDPETFGEANTVYNAVGELIKMGVERFKNKTDGEANLRKFLLTKFKGPGSERALDLLLNGVSLSNPLISKKAIIALASYITDETIKVKFGNGGKWVLQSASFIEKEVVKEPLKFTRTTKTIGGKTKELIFAEVIVPAKSLTAEQLASLKTGDLYLYGDGLAYRIPSSELHSALALKVVGTYDNLDTNIIVAPPELVAIAGSD